MSTKPWLFFEVGRVSLAVDATVVQQILELGPVTAIPLAPPAIPGLVSFRGEALPLLDLARFLGLADGEAQAAVLACRTRAYRVGLLCHRARGVRHVSPEAMQPPRLARPEALRELARAELEDERGLGVLLDIDALLESARVRG